MLRLHRKTKLAVPFIAALMSFLFFCACSRRADQGKLNWVGFKWVSFRENGRLHKRGALLVPVSINGVGGRDYYFQLDTGASYSMLYEVPYRQLLVMNHKPDHVGMNVKVSGVIAGQAVKDFSLSVRQGFGDPITDSDPTPDVGTLGLDFFQRRVLLLDFPSNRLAILDDRVSLPPELQSRATFIPATVEHGELYIPVTMNGRTYASGFFFDTGSSPTPIITSRNFWREITNRQVNDKNNIVMKAKSWGHEFEWIGAPIVGTLRVGPADLAHPLAYFRASGGDQYGIYEGHPSGVIGNVLFYDKFLVILDVQHRRLGLIDEKG